MDILTKKDNSIVFKANVEESVANLIRRYIGEIPVLAVSDVDISKNDSALYDETIAHRIGLIPLKSDKAVNENSEGHLKLSTKKEGTIYSGELKGSVDVVYDNIPITILAKGQELELAANVNAGKGDDHAKFSPGLMFYRNIVEITTSKRLLAEIKKACPGAEIKEKGDKITIIDNKDKGVCDVCEGICIREKEDYDTEYKEELVISLESFGQMTPQDIFKKSIAAAKKDLAEVSKKLS